MKELTAKQLRNEVVNKLWNYGNLPKNIQTFMGDEVAFMLEIIDTKVKEQLLLHNVVGQSEQLHVENACKCENKDSFNRLQCPKCKPL